MYNDIDEAMLGLTVWKKKRRTSVKPPSTNIACKPTFDADYYRESVLYRFIELAESAYQLYKSNLLVGAVVSARAAQETLAVAWFINSKLEALAKTRDLANFREIMVRLIVGMQNDEGFPENFNILKFIDAVDKTMDGKFRRHYEMLCEYAHPNYSGTFGAYGDPNHETLEVILGEYPRSEKTIKVLVEITLITCISLLDSIQEKYEGVISSASDVCHELYEQGKQKE